jgi:prepilin-type N-terminal cleavage/methylation domain-containing protein
MKIQQIKKWFTLVELIVVITILAILATVWFLSLTSYTRDARDANRITSINEMWKGLDAFKIKNSKLPLPDEISLNLSAMWKIIGYRWTLGSKTADSIKASSIAIDPLSKSNFAYW